MTEVPNTSARSNVKKSAKILERLQLAVETSFTTTGQTNLMRQELNARRQGATEPTERHIVDIDAKGQRLQLNDMERTRRFMQGLRDDLKEYM